MTVKELIEELKKFPEDMIVVTNDYEYGMEIVEDVSETEASYLPKRYQNLTKVLQIS